MTLAKRLTALEQHAANAQSAASPEVARALQRLSDDELRALRNAMIADPDTWQSRCIEFLTAHPEIETTAPEYRLQHLARLLMQEAK